MLSRKYLPDASLTAVKVAPVDWFLSVTVAPSAGPFDGSLTTPVTAEPVTPWASAALAAKTRAATTISLAIMERRLRCMDSFPQCAQRRVTTVAAADSWRKCVGEGWRGTITRRTRGL